MRYFLVTLFLGLISTSASAQVRVGDTKDACDKVHPVVFSNVIVNGAPGQQVRVHAGEYPPPFDLPAPVREIEWYCGYTQEFSSNDEPYDQVSVQRAKNGAIKFVFFRKQPSNTFPSTGGSLARTGDTKDACDQTQLVTFDSVDGPVFVSAGQQNVERDLPAPTTEIHFMCGQSPEVAKNDTPFDAVDISRAGNGAIKWVFLLKTAAPDPAHVCNQVHAFGRLVFLDENGHANGLGRVQVKLMDEDFGPTDTEMAHGFTDKDGQFDLTGTSSDSHCIGAGCARPDPYVEFILEEDHRVDVQNPVGNSARTQTPTHVNTCGDINFSDVQWSGSTIEVILYARAQRAYQKFSDLTGDARLPQSDGLVTVMYPDGITSQYTFFDTIHWPAFTDYRNFFFILDHEFGHRIRDGADGDNDHWNWDNTRFVYGHLHDFNSSGPTEGFAFHEGWAEYVNSVIDPKLGPAQNVPDGKWTGPLDNTIEGYVANKLFKLSNACGRFAAMWQTLKANPGSIHSLAEFEAAFFIRNPQCIVPYSLTPPAKPGSTPAVRNTPLPSPRSKPAQPSSDAYPDLARRADLNNYLGIIEKRVEILNALTPLRIPPDLPEASRAVIGRLNSRLVTTAGTFHAQTVDAYRKALETLVAMPPQSWHNDTYATTLRRVRDTFATSVLNARLHLVQEARNHVAAERTQAHERRVVAYLDHLTAKYARAQAEINHLLESRVSGAEVPANLLPKSFWATTTESQEMVKLPRRN
ncbi:MAG TPA: hypothetical protein VIE67_10050 [Rudaea sp.]